MSTDGSAVWPAGYDRLVLEETDSTNAHAWRLAPDLARPSWVLAHRQSAARGRRGRAWRMPRGNFAASLIMAPGCGPERAALRSFTAALALYDALVDSGADPARLGLKWPNDVLLDQKKLAGILLESSSSGGDVAHLVIGIGVNLAAVPDAADLEDRALPPVSLAEVTGAPVAPTVFLDRLAAAFALWEGRFQEAGFAPLRQAWTQRAAQMGALITVHSGAGRQRGIFEGIDLDGALLLGTSAGKQRIAAAEVYFEEG